MNSKILKIFLGISILFIFTFSSVSHAKLKSEKIDSLMQYCYTNGLFNGNVLIAEKGKIIYHNSFGIANFKPVDSLKNDSQFRLGSVTKQFTAMAIMILKERGKLNYDDDIEIYLPEIPYKGITIRHLLTHTSGLLDYISLFNKYWDREQEDEQKKKIADNNDVIALLAKYPKDVLFEPGEKWEYSNTGYILLAIIVNRVSGIPFEKYLFENIFKPLDMSRTLVYSAIRNDSMEHRVHGYQMDLNGTDYLLNDFHYLNGAAGDGAIYSTTGDLFKWDQSLYTEKLVSNATLNEAFTPVVMNNDSTYNYGFGWNIQTSLSGKKCVRHGGGWVGFITHISREYEDKNTYILLTNHSSQYVFDIRTAFESILHGKKVEYPKISIAQIIGKSLVTQGIDSAISQYHNLKKNEYEKYNFAERELNSLGYNLMYQTKKIPEAISIFKLNVESYPDAANPYDSLGEAYMLDGKNDLAIKNYKKSLELNPDNSNAVEKLKELKTKK